MDHLDEARQYLEWSLGADEEGHGQLRAQQACAHALIALVERLDVLTDIHTFANGEEIKSIRLVAATFGK
jgi:hypothetical protein